MTLIADSGSTKTTWCLIDGDTNIMINTQGINPFMMNEEEICNVLENELMPEIASHQFADTRHPIGPLENVSIFFYGAGCTKENAPIVATALRKTVCNDARIIVDSDMVGAAIALCGEDEGIACILGTGANSCLWNGKEIVSNTPALGFILGDEGSGAYIGKRLVGDILKGVLPESIKQMFMDETHLTQASIIQKVYREPMPNRFLASVSPFCARHKDIPEIHSLLIDCFTQFFHRNIDAYNHPFAHVNFVGSIAYYYKDIIKEAAHLCCYQMGKVIKEPIEGLVTAL